MQERLDDFLALFRSHAVLFRTIGNEPFLNLREQCFCAFLLCNSTAHIIGLCRRITAELNKELHDGLLHGNASGLGGKKFIQRIKTVIVKLALCNAITETGAGRAEKSVAKGHPFQHGEVRNFRASCFQCAVRHKLPEIMLCAV